MAVLAIAAVGAGVGSMLGSAAIGWAIGSAVGSYLYPAKLPDQEGPRLSDLSVTSSAYGAPIPIIYGAMRTGGNLVWSSGLIEHKHKEDVGGKGGPSYEQTTYTYTAHFRVNLCAGPILGIRRIWADGKVIYDLGQGADIETIIASNARAAGIRIYTGTEDQMPDPLEEAYQGVGNTPAYRGVAGIVFEDLQLAEFGNRIPNITAEVVGAGVSAHYVGKTGFPVATVATDVDHVALNFGHGYVTFMDVASVDFDFDGVSLVLSYDILAYSLNGDPMGQLERAVFKVDLSRLFPMELSPVIGLPGVISVSDWLLVAPGSAWVKRYDAPAFSQGPTPSEISNWLQDTAGNLVITVRYAIYHDGAVYALSSAVVGETIGVKLLRFDVNGTLPDARASASFDVTIVDDIIVAFWINDLGVWLPTADNALHLLSHDLEPIRTWAGVMGHDGLLVSRDGTIAATGTYSDTPRGMVGRVYQLNDDGSVEELYSELFKEPQAESRYYAWPASDSVLICGRDAIAVTPLLNPKGVPIASIVTDICARAGLSDADIDTSRLDRAVHGYAISRQMTARVGIEPLQRYGFFDAVESDWLLRFVPRGGAPVVTITDDDLAAHEYGQDTPDKVLSMRAQELELTRRVNVLYSNIGTDYQQGTQHARRLVTDAVNEASIELPIAMSDDRAAQIADALLYDEWTQRSRRALPLSRKYQYLDPADVIAVLADGVTYTLRINEMDSGSGLVKLQCVDEDAAAYTPEAVGGAAPVPDTSIGLPGPTKLVMLDIPALRDQDDDAGFYMAACGYLPGWRGCAIYKSSDGGVTWSEVDTLITASTIGHGTHVLAAGPETVWDYGNALNVRLIGSNASLSSATELAVLNGANAAAYGAPGRWEILQFQTATLEADGSYTLAGLLRGRRGTEWAAGLHQVGDTFVLLTSTSLIRVVAQTSEIGLERQYKAVSLGTALQSAGAQAFANEAVALECYSPVHIRGTRDAGGNVTITWVRRARINAEWRDYVDVPLGESDESYEVEIYSADWSTVKRTISGLSSPAASYTAAQQTTDFGSPQSYVNVKIYQLSATVGRGHPGEATV